MSKTPEFTVKRTGAETGSVLLGIHAIGNFGMLVEVADRQIEGHGGRIQGAFRVLHEGCGKYATGIKAVIRDDSFFESAGEFIRLVSRQPRCHDCTHILNANALWKLEPALIYDRIVNVGPETEIKDEVLRCSDCGRIYTDLSLNFCLNDGATLAREPAEIETRVMRKFDYRNDPDTAVMHGIGNADKRARTEHPGYEFISAAVASHPNLELTVHKGFNHRISKSGHVGSIWIVPRGRGVSITANGQSAQRLYREMERLLGTHHREDAKGYRYWQADDPKNVQDIIRIWGDI